MKYCYSAHEATPLQNQGQCQMCSIHLSCLFPQLTVTGCACVFVRVCLWESVCTCVCMHVCVGPCFCLSLCLYVSVWCVTPWPRDLFFELSEASTMI
jgi:hypothetical protein